MAYFCHGHQGGTIDDFIHGFNIGRAASNMLDFIQGHQGVLWMTLSMDTTKGEKQSDLNKKKNMDHGNVLSNCCVFLIVVLAVVSLS
jgi:hypothetical protein